MLQRAVARIDLAAVEHNCRVLARAAGSAALGAVVKADGYGHGAAPVARAAVAGGARWLVVATAQEAAALRQAGIRERLLVVGALTRDELELALGADADVAAWTPEFVDAVVARGGRVHIKLDTGMGRLGTRDTALADALVERAGAPAGLWTHFATADEADDAFLGEQLDRFLAWALPHKQRRPDLLLHAANSAATLREPRARLDLVRCGIAVYGMDPFGVDPAAHDLRPAMRLESYVAAVKAIAPGQSAGYGRRFVARAPTVIGTIPVGYGDGVRRGLTNNGDVLIGGRRVPIVGTVSMDNVTVDLGPEADVSVGDEAVILGAQGGERITAEELARRLGTINYEVTCGISARVPRVHAPAGPEPTAPGPGADARAAAPGDGTDVAGERA